MPEFKEPIEHDWGNIPRDFARLKQTARRAIWHVEEIYDLLLTVADSVDPLQAEKAIEEIEYHCRDGYGRWSIKLPDDLGDEDFFNGCREHKGLVERLKKDGLLDAFIVMQEGLKKTITSFLEPDCPVEAHLVHSFIIHYNPDTFVLEKVQSKLIKAAEFVGDKAEIDRYGQIVVPSAWPRPDAESIAAGQVKAFLLPGRYGYTSKNEEKTFEAFRKFSFRIYRDCMNVIYRQKYGDPD